MSKYQSVTVTFVPVVILISLLFSVTCGSAQAANSLRGEERDPYRWMETDREGTATWLNRQSARTREILSAQPARNALAKRLSQLVDTAPTISDIYDAGDHRFYLRSTPQYPYQRLFVKTRNAPERLLIDPPPGYGINFFSASHDGAYVAFGLSENGFERTEINVMRVADGKVFQERIPSVRYPGVVWAADNRSFYYSKNEASGNGGRQTCGTVYRHHLGENHDAIIFDWRSINELKQHTCENLNLYSSADSDYLLVYVSRAISGYGGYLFSARTAPDYEGRLRWRKIIDMREHISSFVYAGTGLYLAGYNASSGYDITRLDLDAPDAGRKKIISWSAGELTGLSTSRDSLYVTYHTANTHRFLRIPFDDLEHHYDIPVPDNAEVSALFSASDRADILFTLQGWLIPPDIYHYFPQDNRTEDSGLIPPATFSLSGYEAETLWVPTKNRVRIPLTLIHRKGIRRNGTMPTWLTAYGAYGVSTFPGFDPSRLLWLEQGGAIAIAHVRGGGELGPAWHEGGRAGNKINSVTDFISCADYLVDNKYTSAGKMVISGESAGGIIMGRAITLRPELFAAAAIDVGILNTSRLHQIPIGPMNYAELGSPFTQQGRRNLFKIDAYQHLRNDTRYPPVLLTVGLNDQRVSPWQTAKFAARLQSINQQWNIPVLVLADKNSGHNASSYDAADAKLVDMLSFFMWQTGLHPFNQPSRVPSSTRTPAPAG
ncbi:prolyl oligopeptidase family serine peptidase [Enterobacter sp.]|uniref:prolyl oligopeptidase family serine peptidase n=1 Tax=Enterobacter sp. TaxID=42895 RepID=UPI00296F5515|nr:prolyl oligopeptidase family serine peptidase [Enterobacter sp.]